MVRRVLAGKRELVVSASSGFDSTPELFARLFVVDDAGVALLIEIDHGMSAAFDLLVDAGYPAEKAGEVVAVARRGGLDPEEIARKMIALREALR